MARAVGGAEIMAQPAQAPAKRQPVLTTIANTLLMKDGQYKTCSQSAVHCHIAGKFDVHHPAHQNQGLDLPT